MNQTLHKDALTINHFASAMMILGLMLISEDVVKVAA
jgi:hypothetical protein